MTSQISLKKESEEGDENYSEEDNLILNDERNKEEKSIKTKENQL